MSDIFDIPRDKVLEVTCGDDVVPISTGRDGQSVVEWSFHEGPFLGFLLRIIEEEDIDVRGALFLGARRHARPTGFGFDLFMSEKVTAWLDARTPGWVITHLASEWVGHTRGDNVKWRVHIPAIRFQSEADAVVFAMMKDSLGL